MMVVMGVMAVALHLIQTIKEAAARCQIFRLRPEAWERRMEPCEAGTQFAVLAAAMLGFACWERRNTRIATRAACLKPPRRPLRPKRASTSITPAWMSC